MYIKYLYAPWNVYLNKILTKELLVIVSWSLLGWVCHKWMRGVRGIGKRVMTCSKIELNYRPCWWLVNKISGKGEVSSLIVINNLYNIIHCSLFSLLCHFNLPVTQWDLFTCIYWWRVQNSNRFSGTYALALYQILGKTFKPFVVMAEWPQHCFQRKRNLEQNNYFGDFCINILMKGHSIT